MSTKVIAILSLVFIGLGFLGGYLVWGTRAGELEQLREAKQAVERDFRETRSLLAEATERNAELIDRQREIIELAEDTGATIERAIDNAVSHHQLVLEAIELVDGILATVGRDYPEFSNGKQPP